MPSSQVASYNSFGQLLFPWRDVELRKNLIWGEATQSDLRTWPFEVGQKSQEMCKNDRGTAMPIFTAVRVAVLFFTIFEKPPDGVRIPPPVGARLNIGKKVFAWYCSLFSGQEAPVLNVKTWLKSETQTLSGGLQITHWNVDDSCHCLYLSPWLYLYSVSANQLETASWMLMRFK